MLLLPSQVDIQALALVLLPKHDKLVLDLGSLIVQVSGLLLHLEQVVVELSIQIVVLLSNCCHFFFKIVHEGQEFGVLFGWLLMLR